MTAGPPHRTTHATIEERCAMTAHTDTNIADTGTESAPLIARARAVARAHRTADPQAFDRRYDRPEVWTRRARIARDIANALQVPLAAVSVTDDPHHAYGFGDRVPGDRVTVTDGDTVLRFIPDLGAQQGDRWVLLDECPVCGAPDTPMVPVTGLADLGEWLDPDFDDQLDRVLAFRLFNGDPAHRSGCSYGIEPADD
jgi:hypothetical protein